jgi:hypothetical protein
VEGGEQHGPLDERLQMVISPPKTTQKVEDEGVARHGLAEVAEGVHHALHPTTALADGEVPWENRRNEARFEGTCLSFVEELGFEGDPGLASGDPGLRVTQAWRAVSLARRQCPGARW